MNRNLVLVLVIVSIAIILTACGKDKEENSTAANQISQTEPTNNEAAVESNESSNLDFGEDLKWPGELMGNIPEPKGKITAVLNDEATGQCTVGFAEMTKEDALAYADQLKNQGFTGGMNLVDTDAIMTGGMDGNKAEAYFTYNIDAKEGSISYIPQGNLSNAEATDSSMAESEADMTDAAPWPSDFFANIPELNGKIVDVYNENNTWMGVSLEYVEQADFEAYIEHLKKSGFTVDTDYSKSVDSQSFSAYNADGVWIHAYMDIWDDGSTTASVEMEKPAQ